MNTMLVKQKTTFMTYILPHATFLLTADIAKTYMYSVVVHQKYLTRLGEMIIFDPWLENYHLSQPREIFLIYDNTIHTCRYSIYLSMSHLSSFIISNADKRKFRSIFRNISCSNDAINHVDCVIKRDVYLQKKHSYSKNICGISFLF